MRRSPCFEICEAEFRYSRCISRAVRRLQSCGERWPNTCSGKPRESGRPWEGRGSRLEEKKMMNIISAV